LGIFETVIDYNGLPYLPHEHLKRYYEAVPVKDIMSEPPLEVLGPQERVGDLVKLLKQSNHNGFPVVESSTRRFLGLVKRTQIAALLECGVFSESRNIQSVKDIAAAAYGIQVGGRNKSSESTPLMHWAYTINDDRYDHILAIPEEESPAEARNKLRVDGGRGEVFDDNAQSFLSEEQLKVNKAIRLSLMPISSKVSSSSSASSFSPSLSEIPTDFCAVTRNNAGNVVVSWCNAEFDQYWVDLAAVANQGAYTVPEFCPVSKAYNLCEFGFDICQDYSFLFLA